ncbi:Beige/BEACH domain protein [Cooperia oncophora]
MKSDVWDETAFNEVLIPAVVNFIGKETAVDVERETVLGTPVVFRKLKRRFPDSKQSVDVANEGVAEYWKGIACKFGTCYGRICGEKLVECEYRPFRVIPHIVPTVAIVVKDETAVVIASELGSDWVDLNTVLRHSYSNIEQYSQVHNFVVASLADVYFQLDLLKCYVTEPQFFCDNVFWLLCDPFATGTDELKPSSQWVNGSLSNYDYILELNRAAGRVRGEVHNHPIFPWVCDFKEQNGGWRDLSKTKYRLTKGDDQLGQNFRTLSHHIPEVLSDIGYMVYKARVESKSNLCKHVRSKWVPREYPASMARMYEWTPDECIPEFYDDPSILVSHHSDMPDLELPPFAASPEEFIKWHRDMLESDEVSRHLHEWIDLNFGQAVSCSSSSLLFDEVWCKSTETWW